MKTIKFFAIFAILLISFTSCMHTTDPGYASVINKKYGSDKGVQKVPVGPGVWFMSWGEDYYDFPTFNVNWTYTADETEGSPTNEQFTFQTKEGMECSADLGLVMHFEFDTRDHLINCLKLTNKIGKLLAEYLEEKKLLPVVKS